MAASASASSTDSGYSELDSILDALSGHGIDENVLIDKLGTWDHREQKHFRKKSKFFLEHARSFDMLGSYEMWDKWSFQLLEVEFMRFKDAMFLWMMHPWERDAYLVRKALENGGTESITMIIEFACTKTYDELGGLKHAYYTRYRNIIELDIKKYIPGPEKKLLVSLMRACRFKESNREEEECVMLEAEKLRDAFRDPTKSYIQDKSIIKIFKYRSYSHLEAVYKHCREMGAEPKIDRVDLRLQEALLFLADPVQAYTQLLEASLMCDADQDKKDALTRIVVTRADNGMEDIKVEFKQKVGSSLAERVGVECKGSYKDFLLTLLARSRDI